MSMESAKAFVERMKIDEEFAKKIMAETTGESRMTLACSEGFNFTTEEMDQVKGDLTDEDLDAVAGGLLPAACPKTPIAVPMGNTTLIYQS